MQITRETVAVVTGASRGVGKGIALALADAGATVYITGRTRHSASSDPLPGSLSETAAEMQDRGGVAEARVVDHKRDTEVLELFAEIERAHGRLDCLVNNVFAVPNGNFWEGPFWEHPIAQWDQMHTVGLRSHYVAAHAAAPLMTRQGSGLIANVSSFGGASFQLNVAYGVCKAALDRLSRDMAHDLKPYGVASVSLYPGIVRTERIVAGANTLPFPMDNTESPEFTGRAVVALLRDDERIKRSGKTQVVAELASEYGFTDLDGKTPRSLREKKQ